MLPSMSSLELGRLRMSVGYGGNKKDRLLSPIEVGIRLSQAHNAGVSLQDCAKEVGLNETSVGRFLRILNLPEDIRHMIGWGSDRDSVGFSSAIELVRLQNPEEQRSLVRSILTDSLNSKEIRYVVQLRKRSDKSIEECIEEIMAMRPTIERRYILIGTIKDQKIERLLATLSQIDRDRLLRTCLERLDLTDVLGRLGVQTFTLIGDKGFNEVINKIGKNKIETQFQTQILEVIENVTNNG